MQPSQQVCLLSSLPLPCLSERLIKLSPSTCIANITRVDEGSSSFALSCIYHLAIDVLLGHSDTKIDLSSNSTWLFLRSWLFCIHQHLLCSVSFWCMLGGIVKIWTRTFYIGSLRVKLIMACQEVLNWVWLSMNPNRLLFIQTQTLPLSIHHKWKDIMDIVCPKTNGKPNVRLSLRVISLYN